MRRLVFALALLATASACMTPDEASDPKRRGGTTVGNGRLVPIAIAVRYASDGTGIDSETKHKVDALIEEAQSAGKVSNKVTKALGREGQTVDCVELNEVADVAPLKAKICYAVKAGNEKQKAELTSTETVFRCSPDVMTPGGGSGSGC